MSHMAGLAYIDDEITQQVALDHKRMARLLEEQKPNWPPGTGSGYHAATFGWLVDQIIRRVDPQKRGIGQFFREDVARPNNIDFHIGLPTDQQHRVARMTLPGIMDTISEIMSDYRLLLFIASMVRIPSDALISKVLKNPSWLQTVSGYVTYDNPDYHRMEQAAGLGIGNAHSLAELFRLTLEGKIIKKETLQLISKPYINETDLVMGIVIAEPIAKSYGFFFESLKRNNTQNSNNLLCGHPGNGGQNVNYDLKNNLVFAYVNNGLKSCMGELCGTYVRLRNSVYDVIEQDGRST